MESSGERIRMGVRYLLILTQSLQPHGTELLVRSMDPKSDIAESPRLAVGLGSDAESRNPGLWSLIEDLFLLKIPQQHIVER